MSAVGGGCALPHHGMVRRRRMPAVPQRFMREEHLMLISVLSTGAQTVASLADATGLSKPAVVQGLAALYFGGSLTTDPRQAAPTHAIKPVSRDDGWPSSLTSAFASPPARAPGAGRPAHGPAAARTPEEALNDKAAE